MLCVVPLVLALHSAPDDFKKPKSLQAERGHHTSEKVSKKKSKSEPEEGSLPLSQTFIWKHKPHIFLWLVDDQGWANIRYHNGHVDTPHMNSLAREGLTLERH